MGQADKTGVEKWRMANAKRIMARKISECLMHSPWETWPEVLVKIEEHEPGMVAPALELLKKNKEKPELMRGLAFFYRDYRRGAEL